MPVHGSSPLALQGCTLTMEVQVSAGGLPMALPVVFQAPVCGGHGLLQALDPVTHVALLAFAAPLILQHREG